MAIGAVGCGSDSSADATTQTAAAPAASDFPAVKGRGLVDLARDEATQTDMVVIPSGSVYERGTNRFGFGVFTLDNTPVHDAEVSLYVARPGQTASGPYPATAESVDPAPAFKSKATATDPDAAEIVYHAEVPFATDGEYEIMAMLHEGDGFTATAMPSAVVGQMPEIPSVGEQPPAIHTETADDVGGDLTKIDTREPPTSMHEVDFADVLGKEPVVLLFATPALCTSRVCGPVADIAEEVKSERGEEAAFILQEIYNDNIVDHGLREQVRAFNLRSEPWLFVIDADGRVSTRIEGAFSKEELNAALDEVTTE